MLTVFPDNISSSISSISSNRANAICCNDEQNADIESDNVLFKSLLSFYARNGIYSQLWKNPQIQAYGHGIHIPHLMVMTPQ